jgi:hypothetical protein
MRTFQSIIIVVVVIHKLMVVIGRIEVLEHHHCLNLLPSTPCSNHVNGPSFVLDSVLASTSTKGMGAVQCPGEVPKILKVLQQCTAKDPAGLEDSSKQQMLISRGESHTTGIGCITAPVLLTLRKSGPESLIFSPYSIASQIMACIGQIFTS